MEKINKELQGELGTEHQTLESSDIKEQRIQLLGHIIRRSGKETVRKIMEWKLEGKRPRGRPRKRWLNVIDLKVLGLKEWKDVVQD